MTSLPVYHTSRLRLQILDRSAGQAVADYYRRNRAFHQPWFPARDDSIFSVTTQRDNLGAEGQDFRKGRALPFWLSLASDPQRIIGRFAVTNIVQGALYSGSVSYHLDEKVVGHGLAAEAGAAVCQLAFQDFGLHRLVASILPYNRRSIALAERLDFTLEGMSSRYLQINGRWEDHLHYVRLQDGPLYPLSDLPVLRGERTMLRPLVPTDVPALLEYHLRNQAHLAEYNPLYPDVVLNQQTWQSQIQHSLLQLQLGERLDLGLFLTDRPDRLIGLIDAHDLHDKPLSQGELSYSIDQDLTGHGLVLEGLTVTLSYLFTVRQLHRMTARIHPENQRSRRLLEILGFRAEGFERQACLTENGWQDLVRYSLLADEFHPL